MSFYLFEYDSCQHQYRSWSVNRYCLSKRRDTLAIKFHWVLITYTKYFKVHCIKKTKVNYLSVGVRTTGFFPAISGKNSLYMITR